jgi:hypothetical protein
MANLMEMLQGTLTPEMLNELGGHIGSDDQGQTAAAANGVFSTLLGGLAKNAAMPGGAEAINSALERDHAGGGLLDGLLGAVMGGGQQQQQSGGGDLMGSILGSVLGGGQTGGGNMMGNILGSVLGGGGQQSGGGMLGSILGSVLGGGAPASPAQNGVGILGHILGNRQDVAAQAVSQQSGLNIGSVMKLLPILAPIVMQVLGRAKSQSGLGVQDLPNVLGNSANQGAQQSGMMGMLGSILDRDGDGSMMDDILGMAAKRMLG